MNADLDPQRAPAQRRPALLPPAQQAQGLNYPFLLAIHAVCVDGQVHNREIEMMNTLARQFDLDPVTETAAADILAQKPEMLTLDQVIAAIPETQIPRALRLLLYIIHADRFLDPGEARLLERIAREWKLDSKTVEALGQRICTEIDNRDTPTQAEVPTEKVSAFTRLVRGADTVLSPRIVDGVLGALASDSMVRLVNDARAQALLAGPEYDEAIALCRRIGEEDLAVVEKTLQRSQQALVRLVGTLKGAIDDMDGGATKRGGTTSNDMVLAQLRDDYKTLTAEIAVELRGIVELQNKKRRAIQFFTVSFMGKSKAGKSTLHAIVAGQGWEAIGVGRQNTTRLNRVYEWNNLRVIDTPGVAAPKGSDYERIAQGVIDETDLMCWVLTNNNQQQAEFEFLSRLKAKGKPLVVLLNVQKNLDNQKYLEEFLKSPDDLFSMDPRKLGGHIDRIRRESAKFYGDTQFPILPVQLLAASRGRQEADAKKADALMQASRLQSFLDAVRVSLIRQGQVRRSQNLLGSTVLDLQNPVAWIRKTADVYGNLGHTLASKQKELGELLGRTEATHRSRLTAAISNAFEPLKNRIPEFAEYHWDSREATLNNAWAEAVKGEELEATVEGAFTNVMRSFSTEVEAALTEIGRELQLTARLGAQGSRLDEQDIDATAHKSLKWGGSIIATIGAIAFFFSNPVGWVLSIGGALLSLFSGLFESKAEKRQKAINRIAQSLEAQLTQQHQSIEKTALQQFGQQTTQLRSHLDEYFGRLSRGATRIQNGMQAAAAVLQSECDLLNRCYAFRVLDWAQGRASCLDVGVVNAQIMSVDRRIGERMTVTLSSALLQTLDLQEASQAIQESIHLQFPKTN